MAATAGRTVGTVGTAWADWEIEAGRYGETRGRHYGVMKEIRRRPGWRSEDPRQ